MTEIKLREARADDEQAVMALSAQIWEGEDYVPYVFHQWLQDKVGRFMLAHQGKQLVGFGKLTRLAPGEWWLEGLRVDPAFRGQGIARLLHRNAVDQALQIASGVLRFATSSENHAVHRLAAETGFSLLAEYLLAKATALTPTPPGHQFMPIEPQEIDRLHDWLAASTRFAQSGFLFEDRWTWMALAPRLPKLVSAAKAFWWGNVGNSAQGLAIVDVDSDTLRLNYVDAPLDVLQELLRDVRLLAGAMGQSRLIAKPVRSAGTADAFSAAGWAVEDDRSMLVFARSLDTGSPARSRSSALEEEQ